MLGRHWWFLNVTGCDLAFYGCIIAATSVKRSLPSTPDEGEVAEVVGLVEVGEMDWRCGERKIDSPQRRSGRENVTDTTK